MIDFGFDKIALIGAVALIVIGPEKLPRVARTVGHFIGKAQRYVADVKAEVNRSIELEDLKKMKTEFEDAARNVEQAVSSEIHQTTSSLDAAWQDAAHAAALQAAEQALARQAPGDAAVVQAAPRHPRQGALGRGARGAIPPAARLGMTRAAHPPCRGAAGRVHG
jgi:sec-independent protein translocase protein TatB